MYLTLTADQVNRESKDILYSTRFDTGTEFENFRNVKILPYALRQTVRYLP